MGAYIPVQPYRAMRNSLVLAVVLLLLPLGGCHYFWNHGGGPPGTVEPRPDPRPAPAPAPAPTPPPSTGTPDFGKAYRVLLDELAPAMKGDSLIVHVQYGGGCKDHYFLPQQRLARTATGEVRADLWLFHRAEEDNCRALITQRVAMFVSPEVRRATSRAFHSPNVRPLPF